MLLCANKPDVIIDAAAKVGGILANNNFPTNFDGKHANTEIIYWMQHIASGRKICIF
jgi:hypothetical protein